VTHAGRRHLPQRRRHRPPRRRIAARTKWRVGRPPGLVTWVWKPSARWAMIPWSACRQWQV